MFQHILVPVDFSDANRRALDIAVALAAPSSGEVSVLHVIELIRDSTFEDLEDFYTKLMVQAQANMDGLLSPYPTRGVRLTPLVVYGHRVQEIVRLAAERDADLLVLSSHKVDPADPTKGWSSISYRVGILAQCPVMLVK